MNMQQRRMRTWKWVLWGTIGVAVLLLVGVLWIWVGRSVASIVSAFALLLGGRRLERYVQTERALQAAREVARKGAQSAEKRAMEEAAAAKEDVREEQATADAQADTSATNATTKTELDKHLKKALDEHERFLDDTAPTSRSEDGFIRGGVLLFVVGVMVLCVSLARGEAAAPSPHERARAKRIQKLLNRYRRALKHARIHHRQEVKRLQARVTQRDKELQALRKACRKQKQLLAKPSKCIPQLVGGVAGGFGGGVVACALVVGGLFWAGTIKPGHQKTQ